MNKIYHKIQTVYLRDPENNFRTLLNGQFAKPEFEYMKDAEWEFTEKVDGTNIRVFWDGSVVSFYGKTDRSQTPEFLLEALEELFTPEKMLDVFGNRGGITLYGEGYGKKIQKGHKYIPDRCSFILFDISGGDIWFESENTSGIADSLGIKSVPVIGRGTLQYAIDMCRQGFTSRLSDTPAEGLVCRPVVELLNRMGERVITKIKCKDFVR